MPIIDIKSINNRKKLVEVTSRDIAGKKLYELGSLARDSDSLARVNSKSTVGYIIEQAYFGIDKNSTKGPDIPTLDTEIKTVPLKMGKDGLLRVKEPLSLNIINYSEEAKNTSIKDSSLYKKNRYILFICYIHDTTKRRSEYLIKFVFLWEIDDRVVTELQPDYEKIISKIRAGKAHEIHQNDHEYLTLCPKHGGHFKDPTCNRSKTQQPYSDKPAEIRAFRLKNRYMNLVIQRYLLASGSPDVKDFVY